MNPQDVKAEIAALDIQLQHLKMLLDQSLRNNEEFEKSRIISEDLRLVSERIKQLEELYALSN
jgi:N-methylhydantoinase B/oxoprolinase/acetone carboxylase alpha subunit